MANWIDAAFVAAHADVAGVTASDVPLVNAVAAAVAFVEDSRKDLDWTGIKADPATATVPASVKLGTAMLVWRLYQRRNAPLGIVTDPTGTPVDILREDPDIARMIGISGYGRFIFGAAGRPLGPQTTTTDTTTA